MSLKKYKKAVKQFEQRLAKQEEAYLQSLVDEGYQRYCDAQRLKQKQEEQG